MNEATNNFIRAIRTLGKIYPQFKNEILGFIDSIENPGEQKEEKPKAITATTKEKIQAVNDYIDWWCAEHKVWQTEFFKSRTIKNDLIHVKTSLMAWCAFNLNDNDELSLTGIGKMFGNKHWSTVIHARDNLKSLLKNPHHNPRRIDVWHEVNDWLNERLDKCEKN